MNHLHFAHNSDGNSSYESSWSYSEVVRGSAFETMAHNFRTCGGAIVIKTGPLWMTEEGGAAVVVHKGDYGHITPNRGFHFPFFRAVLRTVVQTSFLCLANVGFLPWWCFLKTSCSFSASCYGYIRYTYGDFLIFSCAGLWKSKRWACVWF